MVENSEFVADYTFLCYEAKISSTGVIDPEKRLVVFADSKPQLTDMRPFVVKKCPFIKAFFSHLRLADIELEATRSYRKIEP